MDSGRAVGWGDGSPGSRCQSAGAPASGVLGVPQSPLSDPTVTRGQGSILGGSPTHRHGALLHWPGSLEDNGFQVWEETPKTVHRHIQGPQGLTRLRGSSGASPTPPRHRGDSPTTVCPHHTAPCRPPAHALDPHGHLCPRPVQWQRPHILSPGQHLVGSTACMREVEQSTARSVPRPCSGDPRPTGSRRPHRPSACQNPLKKLPYPSAFYRHRNTQSADRSCSRLFFSS